MVEPINLHFRIPATDPLGREEVQGQLRFQNTNLELFWRLKGNVFKGGVGDMNKIEIPYPAVQKVGIKKRFLRPALLTLKVENPELVSEIPGTEVGELVLEIDTKNKKEITKVNDLIDYQRSIFLFDEANQRLEDLQS